MAAHIHKAAVGAAGPIVVTLPPFDDVFSDGCIGGLDPALLGFAIFGQRATPATLLADGDRVELTRPLLADAKAVRRQRANTTPRRAKSSIAKSNH